MFCPLEQWYVVHRIVRWRNKTTAFNMTWKNKNLHGHTGRTFRALTLRMGRNGSVSYKEGTETKLSYLALSIMTFYPFHYADIDLGHITRAVY